MALFSIQAEDLICQKLVTWHDNKGEIKVSIAGRVGLAMAADVDSYYYKIWKFLYRKYLKTQRWESLRAAVRDCTDGFCEICRTSEIVDFHHLTYARITKEQLTDLIGLCRYCHLLQHGRAGPETHHSLRAIAQYQYAPSVRFLVSGCPTSGVAKDVITHWEQDRRSIGSSSDLLNEVDLDDE